MPRIQTYSSLALGALLACTAAGGSNRPSESPGKRSVAHASQGPACRESGARHSLPAEIRETSGLAQGRRDPKVLWTHNDSGNDPILFALSAEGRMLGRSRVLGAVLQDWEDIEAGPCKAGNCLYIADIGDNARTRQHLTIYSVPEPAPGTRETARATPLRVRFPDGPQDAEAMFVLPSGDLFLVTKGRHASISLYRLPAQPDSGAVATLERIRELWPMPQDERNRVTSATATPDGKWVAIRTYRTLYLYATAPLIGGKPVTPVTVDLSPLGERQGEAIAVSDGGTVWLTSEAEKKKDLPRMSRLECSFATISAAPGS